MAKVFMLCEWKLYSSNAFQDNKNAPSKFLDKKNPKQTEKIYATAASVP